MEKLTNGDAIIVQILLTFALGLLGLGCSPKNDSGGDGGAQASLDSVTPSLATPVLRITMNQDTNEISWDAIEGASRYDLYISAPESVSIDEAIVLERVASPYTHIKAPGQSYLYTLRALGDTPDVVSEFSVAISDIPSGFLSSCLQQQGVASPIIEGLLLAAAADDCYQLTQVRERVTTLDLAGAGLSDLSLLSEFPAIESLDLSQNQIQDLQPLSQLLGLKSLMLRDNPGLSTLAGLENLQNLEVLDISNSVVADLGPIKDLVNLNSVALESTAVSSLTILASLPQLTSVSLEGNNVERQEDVCPTVTVAEDIARFCLEGVTLSYGIHINKLLGQHCVACHNGNTAPRVNLDNQADVEANAALINARISDGSMPPLGPLSATDQAIFARWYADVVLADGDS
ncbi:leucine-rich repeat domain-containing protein [Pseudobacteriovorax antillogorgiicola]|uniref:Leucine Rich repeat-containing protein n=1 Tax=Pseudobacteriovorax antillogorgiicola TaxID=1513793 RepID=A0A1Y6BGC5_9BACT|nr:leucine-rich repeat domain-containing protein [Pseudobacteriovorax antillogorgiicola]TCS56216.1 leucine rich repeat (LRR) protein [Pseudobacteriovorax antillogorgiicola]SMF08446.1 Leucine Rich repeat-containing protein [Pseudobacteriovorax antillogorgiicola]